MALHAARAVLGRSHGELARGQGCGATPDSDTSTPSAGSAQDWLLTLLRHPAMAVSVVSGIYAQAARLWWKGAPYYAHPNKITASTEGATS